MARAHPRIGPDLPAAWRVLVVGPVLRRRVIAIILGLSLGAGVVAEEVAVSLRGRSWITEAIAAKLPKYVPRPADEADTAVAADEGPAVERNGVLNLPTMTIRPNAGDASVYDWLTPKGRMELALKSYPGLKVGNLLGLNQPIAMAKLSEQRRVEKINFLSERVRQVSIDDSRETKETLKLLKAAVQRPNMEWMGK